MSRSNQKIKFWIVINDHIIEKAGVGTIVQSQPRLMPGRDVNAACVFLFDHCLMAVYANLRLMYLSFSFIFAPRMSPAKWC